MKMMIAVAFVLLLLANAASASTPVYLNNTALILFPTPSCGSAGTGPGGLAQCNATQLIGLPGVDPSFACDNSAPLSQNFPAWALVADYGEAIEDADTNWVLHSHSPMVYFNASAIVLNANLLKIADNWTSLFTGKPLYYAIWWELLWDQTQYAWTGFDSAGQAGNNCEDWDSPVANGLVANLGEDNWNSPALNLPCATCLPTLCVCVAATGVTAAPNPQPTALPTTGMPTAAPVPTTPMPTTANGVDLGLVLGLSLGIPGGVLLLVCAVWLNVKCKRR